MTIAEQSSRPTTLPLRRSPLQGSLRLFRDRFLVLIGILLFWEFASRYLVDPFWISRPTAIAERLLALAQSGDLWIHVQRTMSAASLGLVLAFVVGVPIGLLLARFKYGDAVAEPFIMAFYSLPRVALAPLFIIYFGIGLLSKVMMAFTFVVFIFILNAREGLKTVDPDLVDLFRTMRAPRLYLIRKVLLPWIVPWLIASLRIGIGLAFVGAVVGELIGSSAGLGWYIEHSAGRIDTTGVFSGLVALTVVAVACNFLVGRLESRFSSWR